MEKTRLEKFGFPPRAAISGVIRSLISACTTLLNATPTTTATERSMRLLRTRNFLKPAIHPPSVAFGAAAGGAASAAASGTAVFDAVADSWPTDDWPTSDGPADDGPGLVVSWTG